MFNENVEFNKSEESDDSYFSHTIYDDLQPENEESTESEYEKENTLPIPVSHYTSKCFIDMFYYTFGNIDSKIRSKQCAILLLAMCSTRFVKKYGIDKVLTPVVEDINKLYEGYRMKILQNEISVFGKVLMCLGDTLGQHLWGGFKEGVGVSKQKCRHCYCQFNDMQLLFREDLFASRTKLSYEANCLEIANAETETERSEL